MQKYLNQSSSTRQNPFSRYRGSSLSYSKDLKPQKNEPNVENFSLEFCRIVQSFLPDFQLPFSKNLLLGVLQVLPDLLQKISDLSALEANEKYLTREESFQRTSRNLVKYEELIKEKAEKLEKDAKNWKIVKESETRRLEIEKNEIIEAKLELEKELKKSSAILNEREEKVKSEILKIEEIENHLHQEKLLIEELCWKLEKERLHVEEAEEILKMKEEMLRKEREILANEKTCVENQKMTNQLLADEMIRSRSVENNLKRPASCSTKENNESFVSDTHSRPRSFSRNDLRAETSLKIDKVSFINFINARNALERSKDELDELKNHILPELHQKSQDMNSMILNLYQIKEEMIVKISEFNQKILVLKENEENFQKILKNHEENQEELRRKERVLSQDQENFKRMKENLEEIREKLENEIEAFQNEKLAFLEELAEERKRIESYYVGIEEKVKILEMKREQLSKKY
jgi:predicted  nucleic acid-binding Zn-ribbon protein